MITTILVIFALPTLITFAIIVMSFLLKSKKSEAVWWRLQMLIAYDQLVNTYFKGWADESISSRAYRRSVNCIEPKSKFLEKLINSIFFWEPDHCKNAYESEQLRSQLPPELRGD